MCSVRKGYRLPCSSLEEGGFLEPKTGMASGLHDRLEQKPERHQEMGQLALFWLFPASRQCLLLSSLSHQLNPFCAWLKVSLPFKHQLRLATRAVLQSQGDSMTCPPHLVSYGWGWGDQARSPFPTQCFCTSVHPSKTSIQ